MAERREFDMNANFHGALKREVNRLRGALDGLDLSDRQQCAGYERRYGFFSETLHHHHHGEDEYLFPKARSRARPEEVVVLDAMAAEHHTLQSALARLDEDFAKLGSDSDTDAMRAHFDELLTVLEGHSAHEERDGMPVIERYITADDLKPFHQYNRTNPAGMMVLSWVCDGATQAQARSTWGMMPGFVRMIVRPMANRKYARFTRECGI